jgi:acetate kinase
MVLNGLDAIVFTAGIGETSHIRKCTDMEYFEIALMDPKMKSSRSKKFEKLMPLISLTKIYKFLQ